MSRFQTRDKEYLGDGVYVAYDGNGLIVTTEDGIRETNRIYLEPEVWARLLLVVKSLAGAAPSEETPT